MDVATRMKLTPMGKAAHCVPFSTRTGTKMTLYKGPDALATRREVSVALNPSLITALQRPRRADDKPNWAPMQPMLPCMTMRRCADAALYDNSLNYVVATHTPHRPTRCPRRLHKLSYRD